MSVGLTMQTYDKLTKEYYTNERIYRSTYEDRPLYSLLRKDTSFGGRKKPIPIIYGNPQGRSKTFSQAKIRSTQTSTRPAAFDITVAKDYHLATLDNLTIESTKNDKHAFMAAMKTEMDGAISGLTDSLHQNLYRDSSCTMGQVLAEPAEASSTVIKVKNLASVSAFEVDQVINFHSAKTGGVQRTADGSTTDFIVTKVNRSDGEVTLDAPYNASGTIAADDFMVVKGDRGLGMEGLPAWIPYDEPTSDLFFGVDRTIDSTRLAGIRYDGTNDNIETALVKLLHRIAREGGGKPDFIFMSSTALEALILILGSKVHYVNINVPFLSAGLTGVQILGPKGPVKCVADHACPDDKAWALSMKTWALESVGIPVGLITTDSLNKLRMSDDDGIELRYRAYTQLSCRCPSHNGVVKLSI